jgi:predicted negative regulator of RcsB-dependent stress response
MKTERRHELQTNVLANSLARWIEAAKPYSRAALAVVIVVAAALFGWAYLSSQNTRHVADGWTEFFDAVGGRNPDPRELLRDISTRYSGTMVAQWARLTLADIELDEGTNRLLQDRKPARDELREASQSFQSLLREASHPTILQRATFGLARAHEALGELEKARNEYRSLATQWPEGPYAAAAKARANDLEQAGTKGFYDWLAKYEPPAPLSKAPGTPGVRPDFLTEPDSGGILTLPSATPAAPGPTLPSAITEPAAEKPKSDEPPAATSPDAAKPAEAPAEKPAEPAPPANPAPSAPEPKPQ